MLPIPVLPLTMLLPFQGASVCDACVTQCVAPFCPGLCACWAFSPRPANGDNGNGIAGRCHGLGVLLPFQGAGFVRRVRYLGRRSALPWAMRLLVFQPASRQWGQIRCDAPSQVIAPLCPGLCACWAFSPRATNGEKYGVMRRPRSSLRFGLGCALVGLSACATSLRFFGNI